jgi:septum formation protein
MLQAAAVPFESADADLDEDDVKTSLRAQGVGAADLALGLARAKALGVKAGAGDFVIGSDQTLELEDGAMLDKPGSAEELLDQLQRLSGRSHKLHAAAVIAEAGTIAWSCIETTTMHVRPLGADFLRDYVEREFNTVRWSVGGYHVEGRGAQLFDRIEGSHFAVQGLPLLPLLSFLRQRGLLLT